MIASDDLCKDKNGDFSKEKYEMLISKGYFPYEYITKYSDLEKSKFPGYNSFYSNLKSENITRQNYLKTKKLYQMFQCRNLKDLLEIYQRTDCLLLAVVFSAFKVTHLKAVSLLWYYYSFCRKNVTNLNCIQSIFGHFLHSLIGWIK